MITDINELADLVHKNAVEHGFHPLEESEYIFISNQCNNIHGEVQELWEAYRSGTEDDLCDKNIELSQKEEELADLIIRALDIGRRLKINIVQAVNIKHNYNTTRPFLHGKKN